MSGAVTLAALPLRQMYQGGVGELLACTADLGAACGVGLLVRYETLAPGLAASKPHSHTQREELVVVLEGVASVLRPSGWEEVSAGQAVGFAPGPAGAHQLWNRSSAPVAYLLVSAPAPEDEVVRWEP